MSRHEPEPMNLEHEPMNASNRPNLSAGITSNIGRAVRLAFLSGAAWFAWTIVDAVRVLSA